MPRKKNGEPMPELLRGEGGLLRLGGARAMVLTESAFVLMQRVIHEQAPELLRYGFYEMGYRAGIDLAAAQAGADPGEAFARFVAAHRAAGYGELEIVRFDLAAPEATLRGRDLFESAAARASGIHRGARVVDHYTRGLCAGVFSQILAKEVICEELACQFRGDPACEFAVLPFGGGA